MNRSSPETQSQWSCRRTCLIHGLCLPALIEQLSSVRVAMSDIVVVITRRTADQLGLNPEFYEIPEENKPEGKRPAIVPVEFEFNTINFQVQDPENQSGHAYLVANVEGDPVHINRILVDADVVLPIGCPKPGAASQQGDCIYPDFSHESTRHRFSNGDSSLVTRWQEIELANDSLGAFLSDPNRMWAWRHDLPGLLWLTPGRH